jgi:hypothetical protein
MTSLPLTFYMHAFTTRTVTCLLHLSFSDAPTRTATCLLHLAPFFSCVLVPSVTVCLFFVGEATCNSALRLVPTVTSSSPDQSPLVLVG